MKNNQEEQRKGKEEKISVLLSYSAINWQREEWSHLYKGRQMQYQA